AEVHELAKACTRNDVDLLGDTRPDVADVEVARRAIEREPPRVAQPERGDRRLRRRPRDVEPEKLAEELSEILRAVVGIVAALPVAEAEPEPAVRAEGELPTVVLRPGVLELEHAPGRLLHDAEAVLRRAVLGHSVVAGEIDSVHEESPVAGE